MQKNQIKLKLLSKEQAATALKKYSKRFLEETARR